MVTNRLRHNSLETRSRDIYALNDFSRDSLFESQMRDFIQFVKGGPLCGVGLSEARKSLKFALKARAELENQESYGEI